MIENEPTAAAELRALGRLMRHARAQGYTYHRTTSFGRTDWSWSKAGTYAVTAESFSRGWLVMVDDERAQLWPSSVGQLTDVLVALGVLPVEFRSAVSA